MAITKKNPAAVPFVPPRVRQLSISNFKKQNCRFENGSKHTLLERKVTVPL